ncbi:hypothetical protein BX666DRAFT_1850250 [Dichotomocladium elegans]|nr:hypothetical protein BX666DRAFT_1850250 [Dichotomocladium elegans]
MACYLYSSVQKDDSHDLTPQTESLFPVLNAQPRGNRRYSCHICTRSFTRKFNLLTHIRTHDKYREKPYACRICTKRFDRKHDCKRHYQTVHQGLKTHPCRLCTSAFSRKDALSRHIDQKHPGVLI